MAVDLTLAKKHLRVTHNAENDLIEVYRKGAVRFIEGLIEKTIERRDFVKTFSAFPESFLLERGPDSTFKSLQYTVGGQLVDVAGAYQSGSVVLPESVWPSDGSGPIKFTYTAGYIDPQEDLDAAVLLLVGDFYKNRETESATPAVSRAVSSLCNQYMEMHV